MKTKTQKSKIQKAGLILLFVIFLPLFIFAQAPYRQTQVAISIAGTSTMHDWTMTSKEAKLEGTFTVNEGALTQLAALNFSLPAESLKSGKGAMDKNAYSSLKTNQYKQIAFALTSAKVEGSIIKCVGNLTISGVTKSIQLDANYKVMPDNSLVCKGSKLIKMTDYKVEPPSFMFGSVKTGDEITISFETTLSPDKL
jgi:Uncharacterized conserved protein